MRGRLRLRAGSKSGDESPHSKKAPIPIVSHVLRDENPPPLCHPALKVLGKFTASLRDEDRSSFRTGEPIRKRE